MVRLFTIAKSRVRGLSLNEIMALMKKSLFRDEPILVYSVNVSQIEEKQWKEKDIMGVRKGDALELEQLSSQFRPVPWEFQCHHYDRVKDFFIVYDNDGIQHISWIYYKGDPNRILSLGTQDAEIKYSLTLPPFRGRGLYPKALKAVVRYLAQQGLHRVFISVQEDNQASIRGIEKAGFKLVGEIRLRKLAGLQVSKKLDTKEV
jgi:RimJ/RimL family protein N-acetyltransferase